MGTELVGREKTRKKSGRPETLLRTLRGGVSGEPEILSLVEPGGIEPPTSTLPVLRSPS